MSAWLLLVYLGPLGWVGVIAGSYPTREACAQGRLEMPWGHCVQEPDIRAVGPICTPELGIYATPPPCLPPEMADLAMRL